MGGTATTSTKQGRARKRPDVYQIISDRIVEQLERGVVPWRKPWVGGEAPQNLRSKKPYRGVNTFLLACTPYSSPYWLTFKQALGLGGSVGKGERGYPVVFWKWLERKDAEGKARRVPLLRYYTVFNAASQCEGIEVPDLTARPGSWDPITAAEAIVDGFTDKPTIQHGGGIACYRPLTDEIQLPDRDRFPKPEEYYSTLFHELSHSSGAFNRLNRSGVTDPTMFGSHAYSKEELVAEMAAAFLCGEAGIVEATLDNSAAYIGNWLKKLRGDNRLVIHAAAQAQKAADLVLGRKPAAVEAE